MRALRIGGCIALTLLIATTAMYVLGLGHVIQLLAADERAPELSPFH